MFSVSETEIANASNASKKYFERIGMGVDNFLLIVCSGNIRHIRQNFIAGPSSIGCAFLSPCDALRDQKTGKQECCTNQPSPRASRVILLQRDGMTSPHE